jgi:hypothetical protein
LLRRERANAADLNADGAEIGEAAESESGNGESARIERAFHGTELAEGYKFVGDHAKAEEVANVCGIVPGNADEPGNGRENPAEDFRQAGRERR